MNGMRRDIAEQWQSMPNWFRIAFKTIAVLYLVVWAYSAYISVTGASNVFVPILPKDSAGYATLSDSIFQSHKFYAEDGKPETFRTPGYPTFIGTVKIATGESFLGVTFIQVILMFIAGLMIQRIGARYFSPQAGALAATLFLLNPVTIVLMLVILSDVLFVFLYILFFWLITEFLPERYWLTIILGGVIASFALYVRPMGALAFPIFLAPIILTLIGWKKTFISGAAIALITVMLVTPWMLRNRIETGVFGFTSLPTYNITSYNIPMYRAHTNSSLIATEMEKIKIELGTDQNDWRHLESSPALKKYISEFVKGNLFGYAKYHVVTTLPFFFGSDIEWSARLYHIAIDKPFNPGGEAAIFELAQGHVGAFLSKLTTPWWKFTERIGTCLLALCCLYAVVKQRKNPAVWVLAGIVLYLALLTGPVSDARYRFPADPFIYLLASSGIVLFLKSRSRNTPSPRPPFLYRI